MDERLIFATLKIEKTKDEDAIRAAYRTLLPQTNPEDDPEGFKRLREAYEEALEYARRPETEETEEAADLTPTGLWMENVKEVYASLSKRMDKEAWYELLHDDICMDLEYGEEAKWKLFSFLAEHFQLKSCIYQLLDEVFRIREEEAVFKEHLNVGFVDFMLKKIGDTNGSMDFDYGAFQGEDTADYDQFLSYYYRLCDQTQQADGRAAEATLAAMEEMDIYHPLYALEKARALVLLDRKEDALDMIEPLMGENRDALRIQILGAEVLFQCGKLEEAEAIFRRYEENGYFLSEKYLALCEKEKGNLTPAIRHCLRALKSGNDKGLEELLPQMDDAFLEAYAPMAEKETLSEEEATCLVGAYSRRNRPQEAMDFLMKHPEYADQMERIHDYKCTLFYQLGKFYEGIGECEIWKETLAPEAREDRIRCCSLEGDGWFQLGKLDEKAAGEQAGRKGTSGGLAGRKGTSGEQAARKGTSGGLAADKVIYGKAAYEKALEAYQEAAALIPENLGIRQKVMDTAILLEKYEEAVTLADEILAVDARWFPAYIQKQKACFELHRAQEVVNLFYAAKNIFAGYAPIYEKAAEVFCIYRQYGDAEGILEQAKSANVSSPRLNILKLRCMRMREVSELQELRKQGRMGEFRLHKELTEYADELKKKYQEDSPENRDMYELFEELGLVERDRNHYKEAVKFFRKALQYEEKPYGRYLLANALFDSGDKKEALKEYHAYEAVSGPDEFLYVNMARCYRADGQDMQAIAYFKKTLEVNPNNTEANGAIAKLYRMMLVDSGNIYYGNLARPYADRQIVVVPEDGYELREHGLLLMEMNLFEEALADFEHSLKLEKSPYGFNLKGKALYYLGRFEEAIENFKQAIACMGKEDTFTAAYLNLADSFNRLGRKEEAIEWYKKGIEVAGDGPAGSLYNNLYWTYRVDGEFEKARNVLKQQWQARKMEDEAYHRLVLMMDELIHGEKGSVYIGRAKQMAEKYASVDAWLELSLQYMYEADDLQKAASAAVNAYELAKKQGKLWAKYPVLLQLVECYSLMGDRKKAVFYGEIFLKEMDRAYSYNPKQSGAEQFMQDLKSHKDNIYDLARCYLGMGRMKEAEACLKQLLTPGLCRKCNKRGCTEAYHLKGMICEEQGLTEEALTSYERAIQLDRGMRESIYRKARLEKKSQKKAGLFSFLRGK